MICRSHRDRAAVIKKYDDVSRSGNQTPAAETRRQKAVRHAAEEPHGGHNAFDLAFSTGFGANEKRCLEEKLGTDGGYASSHAGVGKLAKNGSKGPMALRIVAMTSDSSSSAERLRFNSSIKLAGSESEGGDVRLLATTIGGSPTVTLRDETLLPPHVGLPQTSSTNWTLSVERVVVDAERDSGSRIPYGDFEGYTAAGFDSRAPMVSGRTTRVQVRNRVTGEVRRFVVDMPVP